MRSCAIIQLLILSVRCNRGTRDEKNIFESGLNGFNLITPPPPGVFVNIIGGGGIIRSDTFRIIARHLNLQ